MYETGSIRDLRSLRFKLVALGLSKGLLFWYAIEKLFESKIGLSPAQIVAVGVLAQGSKLIFELPTSIIADRWSRRRILLAGQTSMLICCIIAGLSNTLLVYTAGVLFWSLSDALTSGVYEAYAYDTIASAGHKRQFQKIYTRMKSAELISMATAGLVAGMLALLYSSRLSYFLSLVSVVGCGWYLLQLPDSRVQREITADREWVSHLSRAFRTLMSTQLRWPICIYIAFMGFLSIWYEYYQLLGVDSRLSPGLFGSLISVLTIGMVVGSEIAHRVRSSRTILSGIWVTLLLTHVVGLHFKGVAAAITCIFITFIALMLLQMYLEVYIHNVIDSHHRATIFSLASTLGYACFFLLAAIFGIAIHHLGIREALTLTSIPILLLGVVDILKGSPWAIKQPLPELLTEDSREQ